MKDLSSQILQPTVDEMGTVFLGHPILGLQSINYTVQYITEYEVIITNKYAHLQNKHRTKLEKNMGKFENKSAFFSQ